ncbi:uncharacterized protein Dvir_GJ27096 [Drosophila virilis]|uniref:Uncharacterized protein n=1 Tax=Drosophila virilis TaxID=7244 RepID=A0A0Q9WDI4_DROVI|nr:uncharacterized protein Dvir_GJ27096 [Drosophila virilis]
MVKNDVNSFRTSNLNTVLLNCANDNKEWPCEPQLLITINFIPNLNVEAHDNLLILDKAYEPTKRKNLKIISPYIIIVSRSEPIIVHPLLKPKWTSFNNYSVLHNQAEKYLTKLDHISIQNMSICRRNPGSQNNYAKSNGHEPKTKIIKKNYFLGNSRQFSHISAQKNKNDMIDRKIVQVICDNFNKGKLTNTILSEIPKKCYPRASSVYKLSVPFPYLAAKIRVFKKRKRTWWMIMPSIRLNNMSGTYVNGNVSVLLTSHEDILETRRSLFLGNHTFSIPISFLNNSKTLDIENETANIKKNVKNGTGKMSKARLIPTSNNLLAKCPTNNKTLCLNIVDDKVPGFSIKIKMPFRENAAQQNALKVKVSRIVTDATTKDALQISVDVINKGLEAQDYLISISSCPLSERESAISTVKKMLLPYISETITFLLPFIMGSKKNFKFNCELAVKAVVIKTTTEIKANKSSTSESNIFVVSRRLFEIETHSRCFCIWNCRCHCIGKIETHIDVSVCQKMSYATEKDAGLLLNCPPSEDSYDFCLMDTVNENKDISTAFGFLCKIVGIIIILSIIMLLFLLFCCKCFTPREEDLIVASAEWFCYPESNFESHTNEHGMSNDSLSPVCTESENPSRRELHKNINQFDLLESALVTLTRQQQEIRNQSIKKE